MSDILIETQQLEEHLADPNWVVIDCRFELADPTSGIEQYQEGHIPGAYYADLNIDLSSKPTPISGRHPLPKIERFQKLLQSWGIQPETQVVTYDSEGGAMAAGRLWWLIRACGHTKVSLLNGGFPKWLLEDRRLDAEIPDPRQTSTIEYSFLSNWILTPQDVDILRKDPDWLVVDARAENRFYAAQEVIDITAGHIPGAKNLAYGSLLHPDGTYKNPEELNRQYSALLGTIQPDHTVFYCGSGVTSVIHLIAMEHAGIEVGKLFPGSWSEWIRDPNREIAVK